jgi:hypothetical protein
MVVKFGSALHHFLGTTDVKKSHHRDDGIRSVSECIDRIGEGGFKHMLRADLRWLPNV